MWNIIPRVLRTSFLASALFTLCFSLSSVYSNPIHASPPLGPTAPAALHASCGDAVINEVLFKQTDPLNDEWVELFTLAELPVGTVLEVDDLETSSSGHLYLTVTLTETVTTAGFIVIHGNDAADSDEPTAGNANFFGAGSRKLNNTADNIVLRINGADCEEVVWGSGALAESSAPTTFIYGSSSNVSAGESIQRNPSGDANGALFIEGDSPELFGTSTIGRNNNDGTLPVTLAWFEATTAGRVTQIRWQTATEIGNAGFNLLAGPLEAPVALNEELIPSNRHRLCGAGTLRVQRRYAGDAILPAGGSARLQYRVARSIPTGPGLRYPHRILYLRTTVLRKAGPESGSTSRLSLIDSM